ncbi:hypothetical protein AVEN_55561-1 [Araneus ventricosus]|uniref:Uncharacterized protein n=1 Tax=Araneus ventricosus TaxID=182803 RepID=A0A4Y2FWV5_ARAVE|nr:hypothetical protein AVEN_55561-1 [Araneus ventricosus]
MRTCCISKKSRFPVGYSNGGCRITPTTSWHIRYGDENCCISKQSRFPVGYSNGGCRITPHHKLAHQIWGWELAVSVISLVSQWIR